MYGMKFIKEVHILFNSYHGNISSSSYNTLSYMPRGPYNLYAFFASSNPITTFNPTAVFPKIHPSSFIGPYSSVIGDVTISKNVFIAPNASIRADEGTPFFIGENTNIQDSVILHGLRDDRIQHDNKLYSIYIGKRVTCAHGCIIHGPCYIGDNSFIGFNSIVFNSILEDGVYVSSGAVVTNGVTVAPKRFVPPGAAIDTQDKADALPTLPIDRERFAEEVRQVNREFPASYSLFFGSCRCTCGLACDKSGAAHR
jgi:carbonic anhydrase